MAWALFHSAWVSLLCALPCHSFINAQYLFFSTVSNYYEMAHKTLQERVGLYYLDRGLPVCYFIRPYCCIECRAFPWPVVWYGPFGYFLLSWSPPGHLISYDSEDTRTMTKHGSNWIFYFILIAWDQGRRPGWIKKSLQESGYEALSKQGSYIAISGEKQTNVTSCMLCMLACSSQFPEHFHSHEILPSGSCWWEISHFF